MEYNYLLKYEVVLYKRWCRISSSEQSRGESPEAAAKLDSHLVAALGIHWAHAVSIRLIFESRSG